MNKNGTPRMAPGIFVRFLPKHDAALRRLARTRRCTLSALIRETVVKYVLETEIGP